MWFTYAAGQPKSKHLFLGTKCMQIEREKERDRRGTKEKKLKAFEVKLKGHSLSAFSLPV